MKQPSDSAGVAVAARPGAAPNPTAKPAAPRFDQIRDLGQLRGLANRLIKENKLREAVAAYEAYLLRRPGDANGWSNLGVALRKLGCLDAAQATYHRAIELKPDDPAFHGNLANVLKDMDRIDEAVEAHKAAMERRPGDLQLLFNYGLALREGGRFEQALEVFDQCLAQEPESAKFNWDRALALLHLGRMKEGWEAYHWRWHIGELPTPPYKAERWTGQPLAGKSILLYPEQGFGDTILAARFIPQLAALNPDQIIMECKPPLQRLFSEIAGIDRFIEPKSQLSGFDYHCSMMELLVRFEAGVEPLPPPTKLHVPAETRSKWSRFIGLSGERFKVGVVWSGSVTFKNNRKRSVSPGRFLELAKLPGLQLYSLQKGPLEKELHEVGGGALMIDLGSRVQDFADTAAAVEALDLVIMTDSSVAHLVGSLGRPVWDLLNYTPYWIYGLKGATTPWYPSMRIFRQPTPMDWDSVFAEVKEALAEAIAAKAAGHWPPPPATT